MTFKILIADDEEMLRDLYEIILEGEFPCEITKCQNGKEAIDELGKQNDFNLIVSDYNMPEATGGDLYKFNLSKNKIPFFLFSGGDIRDYSEFNQFKEENELNHFFNKPFNPADFVEKVKIVAQAKSLPKTSMSEKFFKIKLQHYAKYSTSSDQVFLKLFDEKFIKIIDADENKQRDSELIQHYLEKGVEYVYLTPEAFKTFLQISGQQLKNRLLEQNKQIDIMEVAGLNFNISLNGLNDIGIGQEQVNLVNDVFEKSVEDLFNDEFIEQKLLDISKNYNKIISHSILTMYLASAIVKKTNLPWSQTMKKNFHCGTFS